MVSVRVWWIVASNPGPVKTKTIRLVYIASPLSTQHYREREQGLFDSESG